MEGFKFQKGGKLPGLCGGLCDSGCSPSTGLTGWSARHMWIQCVAPPPLEPFDSRLVPIQLPVARYRSFACLLALTGLSPFSCHVCGRTLCHESNRCMNGCRCIPEKWEQLLTPTESVRAMGLQHACMCKDARCIGDVCTDALCKDAVRLTQDRTNPLGLTDLLRAQTCCFAGQEM